MGVFSDNFGPEFAFVSKGEVARSRSGQEVSKALMLLPTIGRDTKYNNNNLATPLSETKDSGIPKTLDELFQDYGIREGVAMRLTEIGFCTNTLLSMNEKELEDAINTMCKECQVDLLLGERFGIKMACRAGRQLLEVQKSQRASASASAIALGGALPSPSRHHGDHGWGVEMSMATDAEALSLSNEGAQQQEQQLQQQQQQQQQQPQWQQQQLDCTLLKKFLAGAEGGGRIEEVKSRGADSESLKWARQQIDALVEEMVGEYLTENGLHGEVLDVSMLMADCCDVEEIFRENPALCEAAVSLGDVRTESQSLKASVVSRAVVCLASAGEVSLLGKNPETWLNLPLYKQTFTRATEKGGSFSSLAEENGGGMDLSLDLNLSLDLAANKVYNDCGNSRTLKRKKSCGSDDLDRGDAEEDLSSETQLGASEDRHVGARFQESDIDPNLTTGEDGQVVDELHLTVTVRGEEVGPSWCSVDHLFAMFEVVNRARQELEGLTGKPGLNKINSEVVAFARQAGLCSVRCGTLLRYLHCYALHVLDADRSDAMRAMSKARGDGVRQWMSLCCKSLLAVAGHWGWDMRRLFEMDPKLRHWNVPRKLLLLCALQKAKGSALDPKVERRRQQGRIRQARYAAKKRAEAKKLQGITQGVGGDSSNNAGSGGMPLYGPLALFMGPSTISSRQGLLTIPRTPSVETMLGAISSAFSPVAGSSSAGPRFGIKRGKASSPPNGCRPRPFSWPAFGFDLGESQAATSSGVLASVDDPDLDEEPLANAAAGQDGARFGARLRHGHDHAPPRHSSAADPLDARTERRRAQGRLRQARYAAKKRAASAMALMAGGGGGGGSGTGGGARSV